MTVSRINVSDAIRDCAPPPPPCFLNREAWTLYLISAASTRTEAKRRRVVLIIDETGEPQVNPAFDYCRDCQSAHQERMQAQGACQPDHLKQLAKQPETA